MFGILAPQSGNKAGGIGNERRLALLAAVRDRREERRVGFDQHLVSRQPFCRRLEVGRVLEGDDPRQRNEKAEVEALPRQFGRSGEAVEHAGYAPFPDGRGEDFGGVLFRISRVDHQRQSALPRSVDVGFETLALRGPVRLVVIIIEPALADRDDPGMIRGLHERGRAEIGMGIRFVRMDADACPDVALPLRNRDDVAPLALASRDVQEAGDATLPRIFKHLRLAFDEAIGLREPDPEVQHLLVTSAGLNLAVDFLPGSLGYDGSSFRPDADLAARILWLDALVANVDRTWRNPNLLVWHRRLWAIDHGAALYFHHAWTNEERFSLQPYDATDHILRAYAGGIGAADEELAPAVTEDLLTEVVGLVPEEWLASDAAHPSVDATRRAYVAFLLARLERRPAWLPAAAE